MNSRSNIPLILDDHARVKGFSTPCKVYSARNIKRAEIGIYAEANSLFCAPHTPVSYTHLDVYKRQDIEWSSLYLRMDTADVKTHNSGHQHVDAAKERNDNDSR